MFLFKLLDYFFIPKNPTSESRKHVVVLSNVSQNIKRPNRKSVKQGGAVGVGGVVSQSELPSGSWTIRRSSHV